MKPTLPVFRLLLLGVLGVAAVGSTSDATRTVHFGLARSAPADKATVHDLSEIRLWFTEAPSEGTVSVRLLGASGAPVPTADPVRDPADGKVFSVQVSQPPAPGQYTVAWRGMGTDGHVVRGEFTFTVAAH
ncbi:MAG: copper resistance protein CopC [Longimicrobiales bacterium]|nr:copper resistance protein CopC [Longimicrobiales bacterium]